MALNTLKQALRRRDIAVPLYRSIINVTNTQAQHHVRFGLSSYYFQNGVNRSFQSLSAIRLYSINVAQNTVDEYRTENNVTVIGHNIPKPYIDIESCEFPGYIKDFLKTQNIIKPTVIQSQSWPIAISGQNFVGIAQTGTGKTLAYLLPAIVHLKEKKAKKGKGPVVLVLAPTRELARQIESVAKLFERSMNISCACIYGGANRASQAAVLERGVDIVIATPGRLNDFLTSRVTNLSRCTYVVMDEADRMLDMGFEPQIRQALEGVPLERQMLMFSATWPKEVQNLAKDYLGEFVQVNVGSTELTANHNIQQFIHVCDPEEKLSKFQAILHDLSNEDFDKVLVFANTKKYVDHLEHNLRRNGWPVLGIHGDKTQNQRDRIISKFKNSKRSILIATDVAARGLDVDGVSHVINYDFPNTTEDYVHRIGRTGRQQNKGVSHTMLTEEDGRVARSLISVLREANQEVPAELEELAKSYSIDKSLEKQMKANRYNKSGNFNNNNYYKKPNGFNRNKKWNAGLRSRDYY